MTAAAGTATTCRANIGAAGRRRRTQVAAATFAVAAGLLGWMMAVHVPWAWRLLLCIPIAAGSVTGLQVTRNTCVGMAMKGHIENEDFTSVPAEAEFAQASRKVAATIFRDALLIGVAGGLIAAATALVS